MTHRALICLTAAAALLTACGNSSTAEATQPAAQAATAPKAAANAAPKEAEMAKEMAKDMGPVAEISAIPSGVYALDKTHGYVTFTYSHLGFSEPIIRFNEIDATVTLDSEDPTKSEISATIQAASIDSMVEKFDNHLRSKDMFDTETYPEVTFTASKLIQTAANKGTMTGDLTIKDVTLPVTFDVTLLKAAQHPMKKIDAFGVKATTTFNRSDFGVSYAAPMVGDEVSVTIDAEFHAKPAE